ncbi:hypothetical protein [Flammeovirga aprica]|uniref:Uncharacterized protein n=1 Tax=Flammeovirga aprica JL-4 TaxID=694437 RepID=A0A7X9RS23_9BACT|nr:hypothetical protein [Flammeovirga aprica]NME66526.1 hypothetical protein [Flammeovirga aprica JL-4]
MKTKATNKYLLLLVLFLAHLSSYGQNNLLKNPEVRFYGVDFTHASFIGRQGFQDPEDLQKNYLRKWNDLVLNEPNKYNIKKYFNKSQVHYDMKAVNKRNNLVDPNKLVIDSQEEHQKIREEDFNEIVNGLPTTENEELGMVLVVETFNKLSSKGTTWSVLFNTKTKEILYRQYHMSDPSGFGVRNYWGFTLYRTLRYTGKDFFFYLRKNS